MKRPQPEMRRLPQQDRSTVRINLVLDAAELIFSEVGYDNATTNAIAKEAGTSIGSLYRFFPDKKAIFDALTQRYFEKLFNLLQASVSADFLKGDVVEIVDTLFETLDQFFVKNPSFEAIIVFADASPDLQEGEKRLREDMARVLSQIFAARAPHISGKRRMLIALTCISLINAYQRMCISQRGTYTRSMIKAEFKASIAAYLGTVLTNV